MTVPYPLVKATDSELYSLCQCIWAWESCICNDELCHCSEEVDHAHRMGQLRRYLDFYRQLTSAYEPAVETGSLPALSSHGELIRIIRTLKENPNILRSQLAGVMFPDQQYQQGDVDMAISLAVKALCMVSSGGSTSVSLPHTVVLLETGSHHITWRDDVSFRAFLDASFPLSDNLALNDPVSVFSDLTTSLSAVQLKKHAGLEFEPTDSLQNHLKLDRRAGTVQVFHHLAFLKEHLRSTYYQSTETDEKETSHTSAVILPRQLCLEAIDSIQKILFPLTDGKSRELLQSLVSTAGFDPDTLRFDSNSIRRPEERSIKYCYFGARLLDLHAELQDPRPRGLIEKWLQRRSGARYVMLATLIGVIFAVVLGMFALALSALQAWIAWQQWRHPHGE